MVAPATAPRAARSSPRPRPEAVRQCVVSMVAADSEGPEDRPSGKPDLRVEVEGVAGVTSDLGVDLQVTKLWEEGLEASFYLFGWSVQYLPGSSITIIPLGFPGGRNTQPSALSGSMGSSRPCDCFLSLSSWNPSIRGLSQYLTIASHFSSTLSKYPLWPSPGPLR